MEQLRRQVRVLKVLLTGALRPVLYLVAAASLAATAQRVVVVNPVRATAALPQDPDDPAIWINRAAPAQSLILGTMKAPAPAGGLVVFGLDGKVRQVLPGPDRPNNVDVEYGLRLRGVPTDIAVLTERLDSGCAPTRSPRTDRS